MSPVRGPAQARARMGSRVTVAGVEVLIGLSAVVGGYAVVTGAFGFTQWLPVAWLTGTPFTDYTIPGLILLLVVGGGMLLAAAMVFVRRQWAILLSAAMGMVMIGFEAIEIAIIDRNPQAVIPPTIVQQALLAGLGAVIFWLAYTLWRREYRRGVLARHA